MLVCGENFPFFNEITTEQSLCTSILSKNDLYFNRRNLKLTSASFLLELRPEGNISPSIRLSCKRSQRFDLNYMQFALLCSVT